MDDFEKGFQELKLPVKKVKETNDPEQLARTYQKPTLLKNDHISYSSNSHISSDNSKPDFAY